MGRKQAGFGLARGIRACAWGSTAQNIAQIHSPAMPVLLQTALLLSVSNVFMMFAWYAHLKNQADRKWYVVAVVSWSVALLEYLFMIPTNRIGNTAYSVAQLKVLQEVISLTLFIPFSVLYLQQPMKLDFVWSSMCMVGAVYFMFR